MLKISSVLAVVHVLTESHKCRETSASDKVFAESLVLITISCPNIHNVHFVLLFKYFLYFEHVLVPQNL